MVVIVEGKNDYNKIKSIFPKLDVLITNGSSVSEEFLDVVKNISKKEDIVLCLDPDFPGEKIRKTIQNVVPNAMHIFAEKAKAISKNKRKVGIEHMKNEDIIELFENIKPTVNTSDVTLGELLDLGLIGTNNSKEKRVKLGTNLGIGYTNSKQLLKRLRLFGINLEEVMKNL